MKKLSFISSAALMLIFMSWLSATDPALANPGVEIVPLQHDFGDVELGSSSSTIVTITNLGEPVYVNAVGFEAGSSPYFSITSAPAPGTVLMEGQSADVQVTFTPSALGPASALLYIDWTDGEPGIEYVSLGGVGVEDEQPPPVSIAVILEFFDESVANGTLVGNGPGNSADGRRSALRNTIEAAGDLLDGGYIEEACQQLLVAYERCDGLPRPPEFVAGPNAATLAGMILDLMGALGC